VTRPPVSRILCVCRFPGGPAIIHLRSLLPTTFRHWFQSYWDRRCGLPGSCWTGRPLPRAQLAPCPSWPCSRWGLPSHLDHPRRWWSLTPPFHPYRPVPWTAGGLLSVALSRGSPRVGVTHHRALWSPDFPRRGACWADESRRDRPGASSLSILAPGFMKHRFPRTDTSCPTL